jgi:hypothetical protein
MAAITITLSDASDAVTVRMSARGESLESTLDSVELDGLIAQLAQYRKQLKAPHSDRPQMDDSSKGALSLPWRLGQEYGSRRMRVLSYLHPGFGWLNCVLAPSDAQSLAQALLSSTEARYPDDQQFWDDHTGRHFQK